MPAPGSWTHWPFSQISGVVTTLPAESRPAMVSIRPSGSSVTVGYQRPNAILGSPRRQVSLRRVEDVGDVDARVVVLVPAGDHQPAVRHERVAGAEQHRVRRDLGAPAAAPLAGSHSRGIAAMVPMAPPSSYLPQPRILPVGSRWMWSGTMAQGTSGPHLPVVASDGSAETLTGAEVTLLAAGGERRASCAPGAADAEIAELGEALRVGRRGGGALERPAARDDAGRDRDARSRVAAAVLDLHHRLDRRIEHLAVQRRGRADWS